MRYLIGFAAGLALALYTLQSLAAESVEQQRERFQAAHQTLQAGHRLDREAVRRELGDYVLAPYLDYFSLRRSLGDDAAIERFLAEHAELPVSGLLRNAWLGDLARRGEWRSFEEHYRPVASAELRCHALRAEAVLGDVDAAWLERARELWLVGHSQPRACDPVFAQLYQRDALSAADAWRRVELAMAAGNNGLARYLGRYLAREDRTWLQHWLAADQQPLGTLRRPAFDTTHPRAASVLVHAVQSIARRNPERGWEALPTLAEHGVDPATVASVRRSVALRGAFSRRSEALEWLESLPDSVTDDETRLWRAVLARGEQDWPRLIKAINELDLGERGRAEWRYWHAYALERVGERSVARRVFAELAEERNYYGFLAADALGRPYNMNAEPFVYDQAVLDELATRPGFQRALELFRVNLLTDARREWQAALNGLEQQQLGHAAVLAARAGWYDRAITTANGAGLHNALELRFPTAFRERIEYHSQRHQLEVPLTFALLRKESAFMPDAVSHAGAMGLMQVMPATGRDVARRLNEPLSSSRALLEVETNLRLGSAYLRQVLDRFDNNPILAAAAYNAGPHRVDMWLERNADQPPALWIENISFRETREYVKDVLAFAAVFDWQINGRKPRRITDLMYGLGDAETACSGSTFSAQVC